MLTPMEAYTTCDFSGGDGLYACPPPLDPPLMKHVMGTQYHVSLKKIRKYVFCLDASNEHQNKINENIYRGSYMSVHVLLILLNNEFNKFNKTGA